MKKGLSTLGVSAAALLSGSVLAMGPTIDSIPTVIVTDHTTNAANFDGFAVTSGPTSNLFRFTDALDLATFLHDPDTPTTGLKYLFSERDTPASVTESSPATIAINSLTGSPYATIKSNVDSGGIAVTTGVGAALDFRNIRVSPGTGTGPFAAPTGLPESRTLRLYVSDSTTGTAMATQDFTVITTNASGSFDTTSAVGSPTIFIGPEVPIDNFDNWTSLQLNQFTQLGVSGSPYPTTLVPITNSTVSPLGTASLNTANIIIRTLTLGSPVASLSSTISGSTLAGLAVLWGSGQTQAQAVVANNLYRIRYNLSSPTASNAAQSTFRLRTGNTPGIGDSEEVILVGHGPTSGGNFVYNSWFSPKASGNMVFAFDVYDFNAGTTSMNSALESLSVNSTTRALLSAAAGATTTVIQNVGNPSLTPFAGEPTPDASAVSAWPANTSLFTNFATFAGLNRPVPVTATSTALSFAVAPRSAPNTDETFTAYTFGNITAGNGFFSLASGNTLVVSDLWVTAPGGASDSMPDFRFGVGTAGGAVGLSSLANYSGQATVTGNGGAASPIALQNAPRRYTHVFQPQLGTGTVDYRFDTNIIVTDNSAGVPRTVGFGGTVRFDRLTVTTYTNLPSLN